MTERDCGPGGVPTLLSEADLDNLYNVHFKGVFFLTQELLPLSNDGGRIVNITTGLIRFAIPGSAPYAAVKGAEVLTRYLAKELSARGITVNTVAPWRNCDRLQRQHGSGQSGNQQARRGDDGTRPRRWPAR